MEWVFFILIIVFILYKNKNIKGMIEEIKYPFSNDPEGKYHKPYNQRIAKIKAKRIILFFVSVLIILTFFIIYTIYDYFDDTKEKNMILRNELKGTYNCTDKNGNSELLIFDSKCYYYSNPYEQCTWKVENNIVKISYYAGNNYDGYKKKQEYIATIKNNKLYFKDKTCKKLE